MKHQISKTHSRITPRNVRPFDMKQVTDSAVIALARIGLVFDSATVYEQVHSLAKAGVLYRRDGLQAYGHRTAGARQRSSTAMAFSED